MIPQQLQDIQLLMDILLRHGRQATNLRNTRRVLTPLNGNGIVMHHRQRRIGRAGRRNLLAAQQLHNHLPPILAIAQQAQIAQRLLRRPQLPLPPAELVAKSDQQAAQPLALILRQRQDARDVVPLAALLLLAEIADDVAAALVARGHHVEQEGVDVVVQRLVVEEQLAQQAQIAAPGALPAAVDLEERHVLVAVDLVARRVDQRAFAAVARERFGAREVAEAELVDVHELGVGVFGRVGREVPRLDLVEAHLDLGDVAHEVELRVVLDHRAAGAEFFDLLFWIGEGGELFFRFHYGVCIRHVGVGAGGAVAAGRCEGRAGGGGGFGVIVAVLLAAGLGRGEAFAVVASFRAELFGLGCAHVGSPACLCGE